MNDAPQYQTPVLVDSDFIFKNYETVRKEIRDKIDEKKRDESAKRIKIEHDIMTSQTKMPTQDNRQNPNEHNTTNKLSKIPLIKREDPLFYFTQTTNPPTYYAYLAHDDTKPVIMKRWFEREHDDGRNDDDTTKMSPEHWHAYADSGANISIVTPALVKSLGLAIKKFDAPVSIRFGQGQVGTATLSLAGLDALQLRMFPIPSSPSPPSLHRPR